MLELEDWRVLLASFASAETSAEVTTFHRLSASRAGPAFVDCSDGDQYWIKGDPTLIRETLLEQVVGSLGICLGAPIPPIKIIQLGQTLRDREIQRFAVGYVHASRNERECSDTKLPLLHFDEPENRSRFAALAILYTWTRGEDHQFIYKKQPPHLVFSFDHGLFCGVLNWPNSLSGVPAITHLDPFFAPVNLKTDELSPTFDILGTLTPLHIAAAVARSPNSWPVALDEKLALCQYLEKRREEVLRVRP